MSTITINDNPYYYADVIYINMYGRDLKSVVISGKPTFIERLRLAWKVIRGFK